MCGITGYYSYKSYTNKLDESLDLISHRGPDSKGTKTWNTSDTRCVGLGHVRLSIMDLSDTGFQPMASYDEKVFMIFNGEIFNFNELRKQLPDHQFRGCSDSEVLLEYYRRYGANGFSDLRGMFAAAFYEVESEQLILVRDQIGIKPLYYTKNETGVFFSSEIKGLRPFLEKFPTISIESLFELMSCGFVYEPNTGFENIYKIPAGTYAIIQQNSISIVKYFDLEKESRASNYTNLLIKNAIQKQLNSDAKLGVFFSGGLDSSVIAAFSKKTSLFAAYNNDDISSSGNVNDEPYADRISKELAIDLKKIHLDVDKGNIESTIDSMRAVAAGTEELISDYTYFAAAQLALAARKEGFKVMVSGMGADEVFLGYPRYKLLTNINFYRVLYMIVKWGWMKHLLRQVPSLSKKIDRFTNYFTESDFSLQYARLLGYFSGEELIELFGSQKYNDLAQSFIEKTHGLLKGFEDESKLIQGLILDYHGFLSHNLTVTDKSSMSAGLEVRVPFLDKDLYCNYIGALRTGLEPTKFGKKPLKEILSLVLSRKLVSRPKSGFNPPLDEKINLIGEHRIMTILRSGRISTILNLSAAEIIVKKHFDTSENNSYKIWQLLYLSFWLDEYQ